MSRTEEPGRQRPGTRETVIVLDFGAQYSQLIARRVRELNVYSELVPFDAPIDRLRGARGLILSGGPDSVDGPAARSGRLPARGADSGHLLRHAAHGPSARRQGGSRATA